MKPLVFEFSSWCFSFRVSYGEENNAPERGAPRSMGFHLGDQAQEQVEDDEEEGLRKKGK